MAICHEAINTAGEKHLGPVFSPSPPSVPWFSPSVSACAGCLMFYWALKVEKRRPSLSADLSACDGVSLLLSVCCHSIFSIYHLSSVFVSWCPFQLLAADLEKVIPAFLSSRHDDCSSLDVVLDKSVQNGAARLLTCTQKRDLITPFWPSSTASNQFQHRVYLFISTFFPGFK